MKERDKIIPASYLVFLKENKTLLLRRYNTGYEDGNYSLVAGHVDSGETPIQCMIREAHEESGVIIDSKNMEMKHIIYRIAEEGEKHDRADFFFVVKEWEGNIINKEPDKCDDLSWFDINNLPNNIIPCVRQALEYITKDVFYSEFSVK